MISRAKTRQYAPTVLLFLLVLSLFLVACERPLGDSGQADGEATATATVDPNQGGGIDTETTEPVETAPPPETEESATEEESALPSDEPEEPAEEMTEEAAEEATEEAAAEETTEEAVAEETTEEAAAEEMTEEAATEEMTEEATAEETTEEAATEEAETAATTGERTHIVQAGENLYRIGLQYGVSWVVLQDYNNLPSANRIYVGQELKIPGESQNGEPPPAAGDGDTYVVKAGDTLYGIGRTFGVDWREIAEANNIVNPYRLFVGRELTIPSGGTTPPADLTHTVTPGETLFLISLRYGVPWTSIADENGIEAPYVIYPGDQLTIPAGSQ